MLKKKEERKGEGTEVGEATLFWSSLRSSEKVLQMNDLSRDICTADSVVVGL